MALTSELPIMEQTVLRCLFPATNLLINAGDAPDLEHHWVASAVLAKCSLQVGPDPDY